MIFNEQQTRNKIKKELGFSDIPDEELKNHKIQLNSPTGKSDSLSLTVEDYINTEVEITRQSYLDLAEMMKDNAVPDLEDSREHIIVGSSSSSTLSTNNVRYFDVTFNDKDIPQHYTVAVSFNPSDINSVSEAKEHIDMIKAHFTFVKERTRDYLTGFETIISYYQYVNLVSGLVNPNPLDGFGLTESIASRLSTIFEGADELDMIKKQFSL